MGLITWTWATVLLGASTTSKRLVNINDLSLLAILIHIVVHRILEP